jgi:hypothetical protein
LITLEEGPNNCRRRVKVQSGLKPPNKKDSSV